MTESSGVVLRGLESRDADAALTVLADSFIDYTPMHSLVGTDEGAYARLKRFMGIYCRLGSRTRVIVAERDERIVGVLVSMDTPACRSIDPGELYNIARVAGRRVVRAIRTFAKAERAHLKTPHRHLALVGVDPASQGHGIGGALLDDFARGCDEARLASYLETVTFTDPSKPSLPRFYERYGFEVSYEEPMADDWSFVSMTRL